MTILKLVTIKLLLKGGKDNITILRPICSNCNCSMGTMSIEKYKAKYFGKKPTTKSTTKASKKGKTKRQSKSDDI